MSVDFAHQHAFSVTRPCSSTSFVRLPSKSSIVVQVQAQVEEQGRGHHGSEVRKVRLLLLSGSRMRSSTELRRTGCKRRAA
jgi:hypothetical protein